MKGIVRKTVQLIPDYFDKNPFTTFPVKLAVEDLFPGTKVESAGWRRRRRYPDPEYSGSGLNARPSSVSTLRLSLQRLNIGLVGYSFGLNSSMIFAETQLWVGQRSLRSQFFNK